MSYKYRNWEGPKVQWAEAVGHDSGHCLTMLGMERRYNTQRNRGEQTKLSIATMAPRKFQNPRIQHNCCIPFWGILFRLLANNYIHTLFMGPTFIDQGATISWQPRYLDMSLHRSHCCSPLSTLSNTADMSVLGLSHGCDWHAAVSPCSAVQMSSTSIM